MPWIAKPTKENIERGNRFLKMNEKGLPMSEIGRLYGITRQRVHQLIELARRTIRQEEHGQRHT